LYFGVLWLLVFSRWGTGH